MNQREKTVNERKMNIASVKRGTTSSGQGGVTGVQQGGGRQRTVTNMMAKTSQRT